MKKLKLFSLIITVVLCLAMLSGCNAISKSKVEGEPLKYLENGINLINASSPLKAINDAVAKGSISVSADSEFLRFDGKLYSDTENKTGAFNLSITAEDTPLTLSLNYKSDELAFSSNLLDDEVYGVNLTTAREDFSASALFGLLGATDENSAEIEETFSMISELGKFITESISGSSKLFTDNITGVGEEMLLLDTAKIDSVTINSKITGKQILEYMKPIVEKISEITGVDPTESMPETDNINDDTVINSKFYLSKKTGALLAVKYEMYLNLTDSAPSADLFFSYGEKPEKVLSPSFTLKMSDHNGADVEFIGNSSSDAEKYTFSGYFKSSVEEVGQLDYVFEKSLKDDSYSISLKNIDNSEMLIKGSVTADKSSFTMTVDSVTYRDVSANIKLKITATAGEAVPSFPEYKNIFKLTEEELTEVMTKIQNAVMSSINTGAINDSIYDNDFDYSDVDISKLDGWQNMSTEELAALLDSCTEEELAAFYLSLTEDDYYILSEKFADFADMEEY